MDPLVIVDGRHFLHRFHVEQPRAALAIEEPQLARPLVKRFEEIWATGEPGLTRRRCSDLACTRSPLRATRRSRAPCARA